MEKSFENSITVRDLLKIVKFYSKIEFFERDRFGQPWYLTKDDVLSDIVVSIKAFDSDTLFVEVKQVDSE